MNLQERLQTELIGKDELGPGHAYDQVRHVRDELRHVQRQVLPELAANIAADLKGMLDKNHAADCMFWSRPGDSASAYCTCPIDDAKKSLDRYCSVNEAKQEKK